MNQTHSRSRRKRGQALAEMAVMVPFLVIGMMGMLDLGRAFYYQIAITNAVREGARFAVQPYYLGLNPSCATIPPALSFRFYFITPIIGSLIGDPLTINTSAVFRADY